tara:strand:+ start:558 stop:788 length:231 start_codon:yes stop_codon:yes gene_type:complete
MLSGCPEFPDNHILSQFAFSENICNVFGYGFFTLAEQFCHLQLRQPNGFITERDIQFGFTAFGLVDYYLPVRQAGL